MLLVGVNTDPQRSVGQLCAAAISAREPAADAARAVAALAEGSYVECWKPRLRVVVEEPAAAGAATVHAYATRLPNPLAAPAWLRFVSLPFTRLDGTRLAGAMR